MKKTLLTLSLIGALVTPSIAADEHSITEGCATWYAQNYEPWDLKDPSKGTTDAADVVVSTKTEPIRLTELKQDVATLSQNEKVTGIETLRIEDCTITVDDVSFPEVFFIEFFKGCQLNFSGTQIEENVAAISVGAVRTPYGEEDYLQIPGSLTFYCTNEIAENSKWRRKGEYIMEDLMLCQFFYDGEDYGSELNFVFGTASFGDKDEYSGLTNVGFIASEKELEVGQVGLIARDIVIEERQFEGMAFSVVGYNGPAVPEPATGTLSLLALAGLAARRRRK